jgi:hypothetical protein
MELNNEERRQLHGALLSAFTTRDGLKQMVNFGLDVDLDTVTASGNQANVVLDLIQWVVAQGRVDELVRAAHQENPGNPKLKEFIEQHPPAASRATSNTLGYPLKQKIGILIDLSHAQDSWPDPDDKSSIFSVAGGQLMAELKPVAEERPWDVRAVTDHGQLRSDLLKNWSGLLMAIPHHAQIGAETRREIVQWVHQGGRLVLMGFELGDRHHETNLNELANEFGLRFNTDIVAPKCWSSTDKPYDKPIKFTYIRSNHPVLRAVERLRFWNLCTLTADPGADEVLTVRDNGISRLRKEDARYTQGWLRGGGPQRYDVFKNAAWTPIIAEAPRGLTRGGRVLALGTWQFLGRNDQDYTSIRGFDNLRFIENLLNWFGGT